ncbi:MAG: ATP-binding cassette domain-containing protein [Actinomycetota bacterium]
MTEHGAERPGFERLPENHSLPGMGRLTVQGSLQLGDVRLDLDLTADPGQLVGVTGGVGSGKSSALALIAGRLRLAEGRVTLGDLVWDDPTVGTFVADRPVTLVTQRFQNDLPDDLTGVAAVTRRILSITPAHPDAEGTARRVLTGLGVGDHVVDRLPDTFSGAEAQRVSIAAALAPDPPVVLLDEPFGAMDKRTGAAVRDWLAAWFADRRAIVVIASTRTDHLEELTETIVNLDRDDRAGED